MSATETTISHLPSVYHDWTDTEFRTEHARVHAETEIEREWIRQAELLPYESDQAMMQAAELGKVTRVSTGVGFVAIDKLLLWEPSHSDASHKHYYSAPYMDNDVFELMSGIASTWQAEMGSSRSLSITSVGRSLAYQQELGTRPRKLTITGDGNLSSHQVLRAFDIDGCGIAEEADDGSVRKINPRYPGFQPGLIHDGRLVLKDILAQVMADERINCVEELIGTQEHAFHIAVKPVSL